jgi:two-component system, OmpR family, phosphate regulon sensor histidine kinase PhoR
MKKRNTILLFGTGSIIILISVQIFLIGNVWEQKSEMFDLRYKTLSQDVVNKLNKQYTNVHFDTALFLINNYADSIMRKAIFTIRNEQDLIKLKTRVFDDVSSILTREQDLSDILSSYFESQGYEKNFNIKIVINNLQLIDFETTKLNIYSNPDFMKVKKAPAADIRMGHQKQKSKILVNSYFAEENYFKLQFDYYIDFKDKQLMVLKETSASLAMSGLTIIVVVLLFMYTYRNLMEERRLSNLKTDFINNMTHELKTPLSTITVAGKTLEMEQIRNNDVKILETAKLIGKQSVHLNQLINLILEISMWERTQFQLDKKTVEVDDLMKEIVNSFKSGCSNCEKITENYDLDGIKTNLDVVYFTTMINNLLSNAVKYSDKEPEIRIEGSRDKENIFIKVSDNGIGISKQDQKHIFDKFYRVTHGNIHKFKGLGLGLYYVKRIAESHGGDVSVDSKPGKGSIFTVKLPY